jgi:hypothetical protein
MRDFDLAGIESAGSPLIALRPLTSEIPPYRRARMSASKLPYNSSRLDGLGFRGVVEKEDPFVGT